MFEGGTADRTSPANVELAKRSDVQRRLPPNPFSSAVGDSPALSESTTGTDAAKSPLDDLPDLTTEISDDPVHRLSIGAESAVIESVVGRPFSVSASVIRHCREWEAKWDRERREGIASFSCATLDKLLPMFVEEPRDDAWATQMEKTLRDIVIADGRPFVIRALECRTTIFIVEAASSQDLASDTPWQVDLKNEDSMYGYEKNRAGGSVTVTLSLYSRL